MSLTIDDFAMPRRSPLLFVEKPEYDRALTSLMMTCIENGDLYTEVPAEPVHGEMKEIGLLEKTPGGYRLTEAGARKLHKSYGKIDEDLGFEEICVGDRVRGRRVVYDEWGTIEGVVTSVDKFTCLAAYTNQRVPGANIEVMTDEGHVDWFGYDEHTEVLERSSNK